MTITKPSVIRSINYNLKRALLKGILLGSISILAYITIVIATTPELPAFFAIKAAFSINPLIIYGTAVGVGVNTFISSYSKGIGCRIDKKRKGIVGASSGGTAISAFFSFFSLVPLGCCGSWLLVLSYLPTVFGSALSVSLIQYSKPLSYIGLIIVLGFAGISTFKLRSELKNQQQRQQHQKRMDEQDIDKKTRKEHPALE
jgi:hypothetical protein